jgi:hypothetical protein
MIRLLVLASLISASSVAYAVPRMSLPAGSPCATCHYNPSGGGGRNEVGFGAMSATGAFSFETFHDNMFWDDRVSAGLDTRTLWIRLGRPVLQLDDRGREVITEPDFVGFPMQFQPSLAVTLTDWLKVYGTYNAGRRTFEDNQVCDPVYPGASCFEAAIQVETKGGYTTRAGMIQASIGVRPDDHTIWTRGDAANPRQPLIPPNYAEWGAEVSYQPVASLRTELGVTATQHLDGALNQMTETAELWPVALSARFTYLPHFEFGGAAPPADDFDDFDDFGDTDDVAKPTKVNAWFGGSVLGSGEFYLINAFAAAGLRNGFETRLELSHSARSIKHETYNGSLAASWTLTDWFVPHLRVDRALTLADETFTAWQYVAGIEFFPMPFVELRPEYRIVQTDEYVFGQPTVQLHVFF